MNYLKKNQNERRVNNKAKTNPYIAREIERDWKAPHTATLPYIKAMHRLRTIEDHYDLKSGKLIIQYFLSDARSWKGEVARRIKKELKDLIK